MNIEEKVRVNLTSRGFDKDNIINNRGLINAVIDETILHIVKNLGIAGVGCQREQLADVDTIVFKRKGRPLSAEDTTWVWKR